MVKKAPAYPHFSLDGLRKPMVPDFAAIGNVAVEQLAATCDAHAPYAPLPLSELDGYRARPGLDPAVVSALTLEEETVAPAGVAWPWSRR